MLQTVSETEFSRERYDCLSKMCLNCQNLGISRARASLKKNDIRVYFSLRDRNYFKGSKMCRIYIGIHAHTRLTCFLLGPLCDDPKPHIYLF